MRREIADEPDSFGLIDRVERGWPRPDTFVDCWTCRIVSPVVAYERLGPLVPPPKNPMAPAKPKKSAIERQLAHLERQAESLRAKLADAEDD